MIPGSNLSKSDLEVKALVNRIKKKKWKFAGILILVGVFSFYVFKFHLLSYQSTTSFYVNDANILSSPALDLRTLDNSSAQDKFNRIYENVNSVKVIDHLIKKFDLLRHYGIDTTGEFYYQKAVAHMSNCIFLKKNVNNTIIITVKDRNRYLAAEMANEIVARLESLNQEYYIKNTEKKAQITLEFSKQLEAENLKKQSAIEALINNIGSRNATNKDYKTFLPLMTEQQKLSEIIYNLKNSTNEYVNSQKMYFLSLQAMNFKSFPTLTVVKPAMPASRSIVFTSALYSVLIVILVAMLLILQAYLFIQYNDYMKLLFGDGKQ